MYMYVYICFEFFSFALSSLHFKIVLGFSCISIIDQDGIFARTRGLATPKKGSTGTSTSLPLLSTMSNEQGVVSREVKMHVISDVTRKFSSRARTSKNQRE